MAPCGQQRKQIEDTDTVTAVEVPRTGGFKLNKKGPFGAVLKDGLEDDEPAVVAHVVAVGNSAQRIHNVAVDRRYTLGSRYRSI